MRRVLEIWGDLVSLKIQWKTISVSWCEKPKDNKIIIKDKEKNEIIKVKVMVIMVFGDRGSILGRVIPKTQKWYLMLNTQHYKVRIKGKIGQSREGIAPSSTPQCCSYWKGAFGSPSTKVDNFTYFFFIWKVHFFLQGEINNNSQTFHSICKCSIIDIEYYLTILQHLVLH